MSDTYSVEVECSNCDYIGVIYVPKGNPVPDLSTCPNCACRAARKRPKQINIEYPRRKDWPQPYEMPKPYKYERLDDNWETGLK